MRHTHPKPTTTLADMISRLYDWAFDFEARHSTQLDHTANAQESLNVVHKLLQDVTLALLLVAVCGGTFYFFT